MGMAIRRISRRALWEASMTGEVFQGEDEPQGALDLTGVTILLVEDLDDLRRAVASLLRDYGATVLEAASCSEAMELTFAGTEFQVLLTDQELEDELSGADLAIHICHRRPGLRVMLLSRYVDGVLLGRMQPGWRALSKRAKQVELAAAIGKLVAR